MGANTLDKAKILEQIKAFHREIRDGVRKRVGLASSDMLTRAAGYGAGDFSYPLDIDAEKIVRRHVSEWAAKGPIALITEEGGLEILPREAKPEDVELYIIVDPIDGTRSLMYDFRSAWTLTGVAPVTKPEQTPIENSDGRLTSRMNLSDIVMAVQSEIPTSKQGFVDTLWAERGGEAHYQRCELGGDKCSLEKSFGSSNAVSIDDGFFIISKFFPEGKDILSKIEMKLIDEITGGSFGSRVFDDQYICSAGQLYFLATGQYRFVADLRPWLSKVINKKFICARPYDLCTMLIAEAAGVEITDVDGQHLDAPLDADSDVGFIAYANSALRALIEPKILRILSEGV